MLGAPRTPTATASPSGVDPAEVGRLRARTRRRRGAARRRPGAAVSAAGVGVGVVAEAGVVQRPQDLGVAPQQPRDEHDEQRHHHRERHHERRHAVRLRAHLTRAGARGGEAEQPRRVPTRNSVPRPSGAAGQTEASSRGERPTRASRSHRRSGLLDGVERAAEVGDEVGRPIRARPRAGSAPDRPRAATRPPRRASSGPGARSRTRPRRATRPG